jgi:hypothetical protein
VCRLRSARLVFPPPVAHDTYITLRVYQFGHAPQLHVSSWASQQPGRCRFNDRFEVTVDFPEVAVFLFRVHHRLLPEAGQRKGRAGPLQDPADGSSRSSAAVEVRTEDPVYGHFAFSLRTMARGPVLLPLLNRRCERIGEACIGVDLSEDLRIATEGEPSPSPRSPLTLGSRTPRSSWAVSVHEGGFSRLASPKASAGAVLVSNLATELRHGRAAREPRVLASQAGSLEELSRVEATHKRMAPTGGGSVRRRQAPVSPVQGPDGPEPRSRPESLQAAELRHRWKEHYEGYRQIEWDTVSL